MKKLRSRASLVFALPLLTFAVPMTPAHAVGACEVAFNDATMACIGGSSFSSCYDAAVRAYMDCLAREATVNE